MGPGPAVRVRARWVRAPGGVRPRGLCPPCRRRQSRSRRRCPSRCWSSGGSTTRRTGNGRCAASSSSATSPRTPAPPSTGCWRSPCSGPTTSSWAAGEARGTHGAGGGRCQPRVARRTAGVGRLRRTSPAAGRGQGRSLKSGREPPRGKGANRGPRCVLESSRRTGIKGADARELLSLDSFVSSNMPVFVSGGEHATGKVDVCFESCS